MKVELEKITYERHKNRFISLLIKFLSSKHHNDTSNKEIEGQIKAINNRLLPSKLGLNTKIHESVEYLGNLNNIDIGDNVSISRNATLHCYDSSSFIKINRDTSIKQYVQILTYPKGMIQIGKNCSVNPFCVLYGLGGLYIGDNVRIATHTVIIPANHIFDDPDIPITEQGLSKKGVNIEDDVWIGAGVTILDGCRIGKGAVIAAGAVVNKNVEPFTMVGGVPCKFIKLRGNR